MIPTGGQGALEPWLMCDTYHQIPRGVPFLLIGSYFFKEKMSVK